MPDHKKTGGAITTRGVWALLSSTLLLNPSLALLTASGALLVSNSKTVRAQTTETVAQIAEAITVRIEGATQGSGVIIKREGKRYILATSWHVVEGQRSGEELAIYTHDGYQHQAEPGSIKRINGADLAELSFLSDRIYSVAQQDYTGQVSTGSTVFVAGFPVSTSAVPQRLMRMLEGRIVASPNNSLPNGYRLMYSNPTMPGMSGGAVLSPKGRLIGIHARSEVETRKSENDDVLIKTGTGQGVPVSYLRENTLVIVQHEGLLSGRKVSDLSSGSPSLFRPDCPGKSFSKLTEIAATLLFFRNGKISECVVRSSSEVGCNGLTLHGAFNAESNPEARIDKVSGIVVDDSKGQRFEYAADTGAGDSGLMAGVNWKEIFSHDCSIQYTVMGIQYFAQVGISGDKFVLAWTRRYQTFDPTSTPQ